jgi:hypothetical protein
MTVLWNNQKYAQLGSVTVNYLTGGSETKIISALRQTEFDVGGNRIPVSVTLLGRSFLNTEMPAAIQYPDGTYGQVSFLTDNSPTYLTDNAWGF